MPYVFHDNNLSLATDRIFSMVGHFKIMLAQGKKQISATLSENSITHMFTITKRYAS